VTRPGRKPKLFSLNNRRQHGAAAVWVAEAASDFLAVAIRVVAVDIQVAVEDIRAVGEDIRAAAVVTRKAAATPEVTVIRRRTNR
jgi:hypothetical protein